MGLHVPRLEVEGDPEVLAHDHGVGDDLDLAAPIGQPLGGGGALVEPELVDHHHFAVGVHPALEDVPDVDHPGMVAGPPGPGRSGPGGDHDGVGMLAADGLGGCL